MLLLHAEDEQHPALALRQWRHGLEGEPWGCGTGDAFRDFACGGARVLVPSAGSWRRYERAALIPVLLRCSRAGIHPGGSLLHPALCFVSRASHLCAYRSCLSHAAFKRSGEFRFTKMGFATRSDMVPLGDDSCSLAFLC